MSKRKRTCLKRSDKVTILKNLDSGDTVTSLAAKFKVGKCTICDIKKNREKIFEYVASTDSGPRNRKSLRTSAYPDLEKAVYAWFLQERARGTPVSGELICEKAKLFHQQLNKTENFKASSGWLQNFKNRYGIRQLSISGERLSSDPSAVEPFKMKFLKKIEEMNLCTDQLYNSDEIGLFWKMLPQKTLAHSQEDSVPGRKQSKERITFMSCSNASGSHKLKLLVLGKSNKPRSFGSNHIPVVYRGQKKAWVTREIFIEWSHTCFVPAVRIKMRELGLPSKALLILDNAPGHPVELTSEDKQISVLFLPPNCTPLIQPMDQHVNQAIKLHYRKNLLKKIVGTQGDIASELKKISLKDVMFQLAEAWQHVNINLLRKSWKALLPSDNRTSDCWEDEDLLPLSTLAENLRRESLQGDIDEIAVLTMRLQNDITEREIREWALGQEDSIEDMTDDDILQNLEQDEESDEENDHTNEIHLKHGEAISCFEKCVKWAKENGESPHHILLLEEMQSRAKKMAMETVKQRKITDFFGLH